MSDTQDNTAQTSDAAADASGPAKLPITSRPMPARAVGVIGQRGSKYDLESLKAGTDDCIIIDATASKKAHSTLSSAVANYRKAGKPGKFAIRTFTEDGVMKVGVWSTV